jgi:hypothetical protein
MFFEKSSQPNSAKNRPKWRKIGALFDRNLSEFSVSLSLLLRRFRAQFKGRRGSAERETETPDGWLARAAGWLARTSDRDRATPPFSCTI